MPYNGSGVFSVVNTFVPLTTILSSSVNQNFNDIATNGLSDVLTRDGQAGMSAPFKATAGSVGAPSITFTSDVATGLYLPASHQLGATANGTLGWTLSTTALTMSLPIVYGAEATVASATTTNIFAATSQNVLISGTTTITAFDASTVGAFRLIRFGGILTLTSNASILGLPAGANITTAAGDTAYIRSEGSSVARVLWYKALASTAPLLTVGVAANNLVQLNGSSQLPAVSGALLTNLPVANITGLADYQAFTGSGTWTKPSMPADSLVTVLAWGAGGGGGSNGTGGGGGGGACVLYHTLLSALGATVTVTIGTAGAIDTVGGNTTFGSVFTAYGGGPGQSGGAVAGSGGGWFAAGANNAAGGSPAGGAAGNPGGDSSFGGGGSGNTNGANGGSSVYGGAGGGAGTSANGGKSFYGGGGGAGPTGGVAGASVVGGSGGASTVAGSAPGGGGGRNAAGARGEVRVWVTYAP